MSSWWWALNECVTERPFKIGTFGFNPLKIAHWIHRNEGFADTGNELIYGRSTVLNRTFCIWFSLYYVPFSIVHHPDAVTAITIAVWRVPTGQQRLGQWVYRPDRRRGRKPPQAQLQRPWLVQSQRHKSVSKKEHGSDGATGVCPSVSKREHSCLPVDARLNC